MSLLSPLGLPAAPPPGPTPAMFKPAVAVGVAAGTSSPSGRVAGSDIVSQPEQTADPNTVTPSRTMLEVRRAVEADMLARSQDDAVTPPTPLRDATEGYAAARQALPV